MKRIPKKIMEELIFQGHTDHLELVNWLRMYGWEDKELIKYSNLLGDIKTYFSTKHLSKYREEMEAE